MTAALADLSKLSRPFSAFAAFNCHFLLTFGQCRVSVERQDKACLRVLSPDAA
jgi:hypothetical protein